MTTVPDVDGGLQVLCTIRSRPGDDGVPHQVGSVMEGAHAERQAQDEVPELAEHMLSLSEDRGSAIIIVGLVHDRRLPIGEPDPHGQPCRRQGVQDLGRPVLEHDLLGRSQGADIGDAGGSNSRPASVEDGPLGNHWLTVGR